MYTAVLIVHSWLRWAVLLAGLLAVFRAVTRANRPWTPADANAARLFVMTLDIQFVIGALLYFVLSPLTTLALEDFGNAMRTSGLRFWAVEHVFGVLVGVTLAHVGHVRIKKAPNDERRHRLALIFFGLALLAIAAAIPWPGLPNERPLFRW
jgi:hypothetical protein